MFRFLFFLLLLQLWVAHRAAAQIQWTQLEQPSLRLRYKVPKGWYIGGYKSAKKCNCTGASVNTSKSGSLNMVVFYSHQESMDSLSRQAVWGYTFDTDRIQSSQGLESSNFSFQQQVSYWKEDPALQVLRLKARAQEHCYLVYFWGTPQAIEEHGAEIRGIVQSMEVYQP